MLNKYLLALCHKMNSAEKKDIISIKDFKMKSGYEFEDYCIDSAGKRAFLKSENQKVIFHTYWYGKFDRKQAFSIKSLLVTQNSYDYEIWLWLDEDTYSEDEVGNNQYLKQLAPYIKIKKYSAEREIYNSTFKNVSFIFLDKKYLAFRADGFRMWVLHEYGGVWFDLDIMFLRDFGKLLNRGEFVYAWEKKRYSNNALIFLHKGSYTNEYLAKKIKKRLSTQPWALFKYSDPKLKYLQLYPASMFDPLWNADDKCFAFHSFESFFKYSDQECAVADAFPYSYAYHWHNMWNTEIEKDSWFEKFESQFDKRLFKKGVR